MSTPLPSSPPTCTTLQTVVKALVAPIVPQPIIPQSAQSSWSTLIGALTNNTGMVGAVAKAATAVSTGFSHALDKTLFGNTGPEATQAAAGSFIADMTNCQDAAPFVLKRDVANGLPAAPASTEETSKEPEKENKTLAQSGPAGVEMPQEVAETSGLSGQFDPNAKDPLKHERNAMGQIPEDALSTNFSKDKSSLPPQVEAQ